MDGFNKCFGFLICLLKCGN